MIAMALYEGFNPIYLYGFAMAGDREHGYQRDGFCYWAGYANAMGVDVIQVKESTLFRPKVYHLGGQTTKKIHDTIAFHGLKNNMLLRLTNFDQLDSLKSLFWI